MRSGGRAPADISVRWRASWAPTRGNEIAVAAQETEFEMTEAECRACSIEAEIPELYFLRRHAGYGWCFRKGNFLNTGSSHGQAFAARACGPVPEFSEGSREGEISAARRPGGARISSI